MSATPVPHAGPRGRRWSRGVVAVVAAAALVLMAAGCSDDDEPATGSTTTQGEPATSTDGGSAETTTTADGGSGDTTTTTEAGSGGTTTTTAGGGGGGGDVPELDAAEQKFADAMEVEFASDDIWASADLDCLAANWVDAIGVDTFEAAGMSPETFAGDGPGELGLDEATADEMVDAMVDCGLGFDAFRSAMSQGDEAAAACLGDNLPDEQLRAALVTLFQGDEESFEPLMEDAFDECISHETGSVSPSTVPEGP